MIVRTFSVAWLPVIIILSRPETTRNEHDGELFQVIVVDQRSTHSQGLQEEALGITQELLK